MAAVKRLLVSIRALSQAYLVHQAATLTLVDAGAPGSAPRILRALASIGARPQDVKQIVLTHCHGDHAGDVLALREATGAPVVAGDADAGVIEGSDPYPYPHGVFSRPLHKTLAAFRSCRVDVRVSERQEIEGGVVVIPTPGHTPGHLAVLAPQLGAVFAGDTAFRLGPLRPSLRTLTWDPAQNARSLGVLAELTPRQVYLGHGPPLLEDAAGRLAELAARTSSVGQDEAKGT